MHQQVAPFHQFDAHLLREERVLEICRIGDARSEQHGRSVVLRRPIRRRQTSQRGQQRLRIMIDGEYVVIAEQSREHALQHLAVRQHVGNAAGHAQVVFQDREFAAGHAYQVGSANAHVDVARNSKLAHLAPEMAAAVNQFARHHAVGQNLSSVVNVLQE